MNLKFDDARFGRELPLWALRGVLCAVPSAFWAVLADFKHPAEIAAMIAGTGLCIAGFAWFSAGEVMTTTPGREQFVRALKMSAWLKAASLLGVGLTWIAVAVWHAPAGAGLALGVVPDMWAGLGSLSLVGWLAGVKELGLSQLDSFGWTLLATLVQGALISAELALLALGVIGWWRVWAWLKPQLMISPARLAG